MQADDATRTRFGSLEFGVMVPDRADTWTRMVYAGANKPITPIDDPYQMFDKLYGKVKDREMLVSVLDDVKDDLKKVSGAVSPEDRRLLDEHATFVREMEQELRATDDMSATPCPQLEPGVKHENDQIPRLSKMQIDLLVNSFANDFARIATLQFTNSVGGARMRWIGVDEGHHELSHEPDSNEKAVDKLTKINHWWCEQLAYLAKRLAETPEPGGRRQPARQHADRSGPTNWARATRTRSTTSPSCSSAAGWISRWAARSSCPKCRTTGCSWRWPMASATTSRHSATRISAATGR